MEAQFLVGWKSFAAFSGFSIRTLKRWHYEKAPIPFKKTGVGKQQNSVVADKDDFKAWLLRAVLNPAKLSDRLLGDVPIVPIMSPFRSH